MRTIILLFIILLMAGCQNLQHKAFRITSTGLGGKYTTVDPAGTGTPLPQVIFGQFTNIITTVPAGAKVEAETITYQLWSEKPSFKETLKIDATKMPATVEYTAQALEDAKD